MRWWLFRGSKPCSYSTQTWKQHHSGSCSMLLASPGAIEQVCGGDHHPGEIIRVYTGHFLLFSPTRSLSTQRKVRFISGTTSNPGWELSWSRLAKPWANVSHPHWQTIIFLSFLFIPENDVPRVAMEKWNTHNNLVMPLSHLHRIEWSCPPLHVLTWLISWDLSCG